MSAVIIAGDTSGSVTLQAPAVAGLIKAIQELKARIAVLEAK